MGSLFKLFVSCCVSLLGDPNGILKKPKALSGPMATPRLDKKEERDSKKRTSDSPAPADVETQNPAWHE